MSGDRRLTYATAGVDLDAADAVVEAIRPHVERTRRPEVLGSIGGFGGLFAVELSRWRQPVLVTATDGVGTKLELARRLDRLEGIGVDLVAMVVDDLVVSGAEPQVFLDYLAIERLDPVVVERVVAGIADGCVQAGCALVGGETAEHPGTMPAGAFDVAGFGVGLVERDQILGPHRVVEGDALVAMAASGVHANGFSLVRRIVEGRDLAADHGLDRPLGEVLLEPTRIYARACLDLAAEGLVHALCHVTGGGLPGNLPRVLPDGLGATLQPWPVPAVFGLLQRWGGVSDEEMARVFNLGIGMVAVVPGDAVEPVLERLAAAQVPAWRCGTVTPGGGVRLPAR